MKNRSENLAGRGQILLVLQVNSCINQVVIQIARRRQYRSENMAANTPSARPASTSSATCWRVARVE